jgi:hypothetical protein
MRSFCPKIGVETKTPAKSVKPKKVAMRRA